MSSSSHLRTIVGQILVGQKEVLFQKAGHFPVPNQQIYRFPKNHDAPMLAAHNLLQLGAGRHPYVSFPLGYHNILVGKKLSTGTPKPQRRDKMEGVYWRGYSLSLPRILICNDTLCYLNPCSPCTKKSIICLQICGKERSRRESPANVYFTYRYFSHKRQLLQRSFWKASL